MGPHTVESVAARITESIEPSGAEEVLAILRTHAGEPLTRRIVDKLPGGRVDWRFTQELGWTKILNRAFKASGGANPHGIELLLARTEESVPIDPAWVERENTRYFAGRRQRNVERAALILDRAYLAELANVMNQAEAVLAALQQVKTTFGELAGPSGRAGVVRVVLERACGLRDET